MSENITVEKIRHVIENLVADGSQDHVNELSNLLLARNADPHFLQALFCRLSGENNIAFRKYRKSARQDISIQTI